MRALSSQGLSTFRANIATLISNRTYLAEQLLALPSILALPGAGDANFLLAQVGGTDGKPDNERAKRVYTHMAEQDQVVVRFRGNEVGCEACLRITVGTRQECERVVERLTELLK